MSSPNEYALVVLDPRNVEVMKGRNPRFDYGNITELAESIRNNGMMEPAKVQEVDGIYQLINGHRRHKACMVLVEEGHVPEFLAMVVPRLDDEVANKRAIAAAMIVANDGKAFLPLEESQKLQEMRTVLEMSNKEIAAAIGRSVSHVSNRLSLLNSDESVKEALTAGELKPQEALAIVHKSNGDKEKQRDAVQRIKSGETGVVNKELLKGRFNKEQWEVIHSMLLSLEVYNVNLDDLETKYADSENPEVMEAYIAGCFQACADLAFTPVKEFFEKVKARVDSERADAPVGKAPEPAVKPKVEVVKVEEKPAKPAKTTKPKKAKKEVSDD